MPFIAIVIASALMSLGRRVSIAAAGLALAAFGLAAIRSLDVDYQRPDYRQVARFIDKTAGPGDPVITQDPSAWRIYSDKKPKVFEGDRDEDEAWKSAAAGKSVFVVRGQLESGLPLLGGPRGRVALREARRYRGLVPLAVGRYAGDVRVTLVRHDGRERLLLSGGRSIEVSAASARGFVDEISLDGKLLNVLGWATDPNGHAADQVLLFSGRRLIAAGSVNRFRKDVAEALGNDAVLSGFLLTVPARLVNISRVSVVTLIGHRAGELNLGESAIRHD
jgi:hypothetical protein